MNVTAITVPQFNSTIAGILFGSRKKGPMQCLGSRVAAGEIGSLRPQSNATTSRSWWVWLPMRSPKPSRDFALRDPEREPLAMVAEALDALGTHYRIVNQRQVADCAFAWQIDAGLVDGTLLRRAQRKVVTRQVAPGAACAAGRDGVHRRPHIGLARSAAAPRRRDHWLQPRYSASRRSAGRSDIRRPRAGKSGAAPLSTSLLAITASPATVNPMQRRLP
jgi:hypothetical protein